MLHAMDATGVATMLGVRALIAVCIDEVFDWT